MLSSGNGDKETDLNNYFEDKLRLLDKSRLAVLAVMSTRDVEDILGVQLPLPDISMKEPE